MTTKVADLSIEELKDIIREVIDDYLAPDGELNQEFAVELAERMKSGDWLDHDIVWHKIRYII